MLYKVKFYVKPMSFSIDQIYSLRITTTFVICVTGVKCFICISMQITTNFAQKEKNDVYWKELDLLLIDL